MRSLFESNMGGDCLGSHLVNQIDVMYNLYTLQNTWGVGAQITCNIYNVLGGKKTAHYAFIKFNQHDCFLDIDTQGRNSIMNSSHQSINGWMKFLKSAIDCEALLHTYYKKGRGEVISMGW